MMVFLESSLNRVEERQGEVSGIEGKSLGRFRRGFVGLSRDLVCVML
jgi:hypothetical protein